ncbi:MAG: hypothetical protein ACTHLZ_06025, partial [Tepidisphaeraceae bacterium]
LNPLPSVSYFDAIVSGARPRPRPQVKMGHVVGIAMGLLGFFGMMPYAAVSFGNSTAIQAGNLLTWALALCTLPCATRRAGGWLVAALMLPLLISAAHLTYAGGDLLLSTKAILVWALSTLTVYVMQAFCPSHIISLLTGIAVATIVHAALGIWQYVAFRDGYVPLLDYYRNPSFLSLQDNYLSMAIYMRRPFGFFPEPSAMASSLAPFVLIFGGIELGVIRLRERLHPALRALVAAAGVGGLGLILLSQSGHAIITLLGAAGLLAAWLRGARATPRSIVLFILIVGALALLGVATVSQLAGRFDGHGVGNGSWTDRSESMLIGLTHCLGRDGLTALFGVGPGQSSVILARDAGLEAVWSVLLAYIYECGVFGFVAVCAVGIALLQAWREARYSIAFFCIGGVWLAGITLTTSYSQLLSLWIVLGLLSAWPSAFGGARAPEGFRRVSRRTPARLTRSQVI